jgi:hypothetical protein
MDPLLDLCEQINLPCKAMNLPDTERHKPGDHQNRDHPEKAEHA